MLFPLASFLIADAAFGYGVSRLFKKNKPLYFQILVCAAGCFAIQQLSAFVNLWCGVSAVVSIGMFGIFGCNYFLLSANYGTLDKVVDDGENTRLIRLTALIAPVLMAILTAAVFLIWKDKDMFCAVMWLLILIPALPASYFNLKHILLPPDPFGSLKTTKPCNISALAFKERCVFRGKRSALFLLSY